MKMRLKRSHPVGAGLVCLCAGQTRDAADRLNVVVADPVRSVHRSRMALKRARSGLRLLEEAGADWALPPQFRLGGLARRMSADRDSAVTAALAGRVARRLRGRARDVAMLVATRKSRLHSSEVAQIQEALYKEAQELEGAPAPVISPGQLRDLLRQSLNRTMRRYREAARKKTLSRIHDWRKAVIVLRDQSSLAVRHWPKGAGAACPILERLARELGRRGDIALLLEAVRCLRVPPAQLPARRVLIARLGIELERATEAVLRRWPPIERRLVGLLGK